MKHARRPPYLLPVEKATLAYMLVTALYLTVFDARVDTPALRFGVRSGVAFLIWILACVYASRPSPVIRFVRYFLPFALLSYWYPETYYFNDFIFPNLDAYFDAADRALFGCSPSLEFSAHAPWAWFSELMYFGYFSYYFIFFGTALWCFIKDSELASRAVFLFTCSFYLYYLIFALLPVVGPQFYYAPPLNNVPDGYIFCDLMRFLQATGEKPTGAFPSSHVGITFTVVIFISRYCKNLLKYALPMFIILVFSTVYIKAHYLIDVIGGFASVALTWPLVNKISDLLHRDFPR